MDPGGQWGPVERAGTKGNCLGIEENVRDTEMGLLPGDLGSTLPGYKGKGVC